MFRIAIVTKIDGLFLNLSFLEGIKNKCVLKNKYRSFLREYRQEKQVSSPGLEEAVKYVAQLANTMSPKTIRACWKRMGLKRFQNFEVSLSEIISIKRFLG